MADQPICCVAEELVIAINSYHTSGIPGNPLTVYGLVGAQVWLTSLYAVLQRS